jgi:hypothetical protein
MVKSRKVVGFLALVAVVSFVAVPAMAGLIGTGLAYNDGVNPTWEGSKTFSQPVTGGTLAGRVEWAVFTAANYSSLFTDYTPTPGELVYTYQIFNTGTVVISKGMAALLSSAPADNVAYFTSNGMSGVAPSAMSIIPADVIWNFASPSIGWSPADNSTGLVFSSIRKPRNDFYVVVDGGGSVNVTGVGGPGTVPIPEPSALALLGVAMALGIVAVRNRR